MQYTRISLGAAVAFAIAAFVACSDAPVASNPSAADGGDVSSSSGSGSGSSSSGSASDNDASDDASKAADALAATGKTAVTAKIGNVSRMLVRAQFGTENDDAGKPRAHVEAHLGGDPACPSTDPDAAATAQPDYTLVVSNVPRGNVGDVFTKADDGVTAAYFDFKGDQLASKPLTQATAVTVTIVATTPTTPTTFEIEVSATFAEGTASGRIAAQYCDSLSL